MVTDDARMVDPGACQVEAWQRVNRGSRERWAFPACNPTGALEITLGGNDLPDDMGGRANEFVLQGKTVFRPLETNGYAYGLAAGTYLRGDPEPQQERVKTVYFYVPVSKSFLDDRVVAHVNVGAQHERDAGRNSWTWGAGAEMSLASNLYLIAESYGDDRTRPFVQAGLRWWIVPNRFQVDATLGAQSGSIHDSRWFSIGLRIISPPFLK